MIYQHIEPSNCIVFHKIPNPYNNPNMAYLEPCINSAGKETYKFTTPPVYNYGNNPEVRNIRMKADYKLEDVINYETMIQSLHDCKLGKMWKDSMLQFNAYSDFYFENIISGIYSKRFRFGTLYHTYINERGKVRLVCSLKAQDRVVQKAINQNFILPAFTPSLVNGNCASLRDRGITYALNKFKHQLFKAYMKWGNNFYVLKCDIHGYFDSISHDYIYDLISQYTSDDRLLYLFRNVFNEYKYDSFIHNGERVPYGIGLGGEMPQSFGIICLNELDHLIEEELHIQVVRYMDDFILLHNDYNYLMACMKFIKEYLLRIGLQLNEKKTNIIHIKDGAIFLKFHFYLKDTGKVIMIASKEGRIREQRKLKSMSDLLDEGLIEYSDILGSFKSWRGHVQLGNNKYVIDYMNALFDSLFIEGFV